MSKAHKMKLFWIIRNWIIRWRLHRMIKNYVEIDLYAIKDVRKNACRYVSSLQYRYKKNFNRWIPLRTISKHLYKAVLKKEQSTQA